MQLAIKAHSNNEYWGTDYFLLALTPERLASLKTHQANCQQFLRQFHPQPAGFVSLYDNILGVSFTAYSFNDKSDPPDLIALQGLEGPEFALLPDTFQPNDNDRCRTEAESLHFWLNGDIYLKAWSKDSRDTVKALLPPLSELTLS